MERALPEDASYRDPAGRVYLLGDRILRSVTSVGAADYEFLRDCGLLDDLTRDGRLIGCTEVEPNLLGAAPRNLIGAGPAGGYFVDRESPPQNARNRH